MYQLPKVSKKYFNLTLNPVPSTLQSGFAILPLLIVLMLIGIAAGTFLVQKGVNFLPKADEDPSGNDSAIAAIRALPEDAGFRVVFPNGAEQDRFPATKFPSFSVIKLWIAAAAFKEYGLDNSEINKLVTPMLLNSDNNAANTLINKLSFEAVNSYIRDNNYTETYLGRHMLETGTVYDNTTSPQNAMWFMQNLIQNKIVSPEVSERIRSLLAKRNSSGEAYYKDPPDVNKTLIGKSGILDPGRNNVGTFLDKNGKRVYFAIFAPTGGTSSEEKITKIEQALYNAGQAAAAPAAAPPQGAPAAQPASGKSPAIARVCDDAEAKKYSCTTGCTVDPAGWHSCTYPEGTADGAKCNKTNQDGCQSGENCIVIDRLPRCIRNACLPAEVTHCNDGGVCTTATKKISGTDYTYTYCGPKTSATAPAAGAPAAAPQAGAPAVAPQSASTKGGDPWAVDSRGNSEKVNQVFATAAKATSGSFDSATDAIDAAKKAKAAYVAGFNKAYTDVFKADIATDSDAQAERDKQANYVAVHAYVATDPSTKGKTWDQVASGELLKGVIDNLKTNGVIPSGADLSKITPPNSVPGSNGSALQQASAVNCNDFTDSSGITIPCYKVGVFTSFDDLQATRNQATIATSRYEKSQEILNAAKAKVTDEVAKAVLAAAQEKLNQAKEKAAACMKQ